MINFTTLSFVVSNLLIVPIVIAYSSGPPTSACEDLTPVHGLPQELQASPFRVKADKDHYAPGGQVIVTVESSGVYRFMGLMLQAREKGKVNPVGTFVELPSNTQHLRCRNIKDTVGHNELLNTTQITLKWKAPAETSEIGEIVFVATVVEDFFTYWRQVSSSELHKKGQAGSFEKNKTLGTTPSVSNIETSKDNHTSTKITFSELPSPSVPMHSDRLNIRLETLSPLDVMTSPESLPEKVQSSPRMPNLHGNVTNGNKTEAVEVNIIPSRKSNQTCPADQCKNNSRSFCQSIFILVVTYMLFQLC